MRAIVTGGLGFIGSNLCRRLVALGHDVLCIDNLSTGHIGNADINIFSSMSGKFSHVCLDVCDKKLIELFSGHDIVFHVAALPRIQLSTDFPIETHAANVDGTVNVLEAARFNNIKRVVFSSSSSIYGDLHGIYPTPENTNTNPKSLYGLHKLIGEQYCRMYGRVYGLDTICLRYHNVFGRGARMQKKYNLLITALMGAVNGYTDGVTIFGDGTIERDYTPVECIVEANLLAAYHNKKFLGDAFNIALGESRSINQIYDIICGLSGVMVPKKYTRSNSEDSKKTMADISKARTLLGYDPSISFEDGIQKTLDWWKLGCPFKWGV